MHNLFKYSISFSVILFLTIFTRLIPHPPNFTIVIGLAFYVPIIFGIRSSILILISFIISDLILGLHETILFTWGSILLITIIANKYSETLLKRIIGIFLSILIFYILSNLGVWLYKAHGLDKNILEIYLSGSTFLQNTILSTLLFSILLEIYFSLININKKKINYSGE